MTEPEGENSGATRASGDEYMPAFEVPKRRIWPFLLGALVIAGVVAFVMYRNANKPEPLRVLIAIDLDGYWWEDSEHAATLADEIGDFLHDRGFEIVRAGQPNVNEVLKRTKSPLDAARELKAAYVITGVVDPTVEKLPIDGGYVEVFVETRLDVTYTPDDKPFFTAPIELSEGARGRDRAIERLAKLAGEVARAEMLPALMEHPAIDDILTGHDPVLIDQLQPAKRFVNARKRLIDEKLAAYQKAVTAREESERGQSTITYHSDMRAEDQLVGVAEQGVLRVSVPVELFYDPKRAEILRRVQSETLEWEKDGHTQEVWWRGYNCFTYPSLSRDGDTAVMVEDLHGVARALTVIREGNVKRIRVEHSRAISEPRLSPGAHAVALVDKECRRCATEIAVLSLEDAKEVLRIGPDDYALIGGFKWLDDQHLLLVGQPPLPPEPEVEEDEGEDDDDDGEEEEPPEPDPLGVYAVGLDGEWELLVDKGYRTYRDPVVSPDGKQLAVSDNDKRILLMDLATKKDRVIEVGGRAAALAYSPDGSKLVFEVDRLKDTSEEEIMLLDVATGKLTRMTQNLMPDRYPLFSADGKQIIFEARHPDPVFTRTRAVSRIASVPVP